MVRFAALLRGINVGKGNRIAMAALRTLLESLGHREVATLLNSGNAVFEAAGRATPAHHAAAIRTALCERHDIDVPVIVKSAGELKAIAADCPLTVDEADAGRLLVIFMQDPKRLTLLAPLAGLVTGDERYALGTRAGYLYCAGGISDSEAAAFLLGKSGKETTTRNWATLGKLLALLEKTA